MDAPATSGESSVPAASSASLVPSLLLSPTERRYLIQGIQADLRNDGRSRLDYRFFHLTTNPIPHAAGSARIRLDGTDVLVAATLDVSPVDVARPEEGIVQCSVEFAASAALSSTTSAASHAVAVRLSDALSGLLVRSACVDARQLCILRGSQCWTLYVDALILSSAGNLLSAISLAALAALLTTSIPAVTVTPSASPSSPPEVELTDAEPTPLQCGALPVAVSLHGYGPLLVLDATEEEEEGADWEVSVGVEDNGRLVWLRKGGRGGVKPKVLAEALRVGRKAGTELNAMVRKLVRAEQSQSSHHR